MHHGFVQSVHIFPNHFLTCKWSKVFCLVITLQIYNLISENTTAPVHKKGAAKLIKTQLYATPYSNQKQKCKLFQSFTFCFFLSQPIAFKSRKNSCSGEGREALNGRARMFGLPGVVSGAGQAEECIPRGFCKY